MARYQKQRVQYPMGSVSSGTMRAEDLIPAFTDELEYRLRHTSMSRKQRTAHSTLCREVRKNLAFVEALFLGCAQVDADFESETACDDLDALFDALGEYAGPYFYFGAHPGDGADYGYWLSEGFEEDFDGHITQLSRGYANHVGGQPDKLKVSDLSEVPKWFRGEVLCVNDHGNATLYVQTSRGLREIWAVV